MSPKPRRAEPEADSQKGRPLTAAEQRAAREARRTPAAQRYAEELEDRQARMAAATIPQSAIPTTKKGNR